jgi:hypothetical protein
LDDIVTNVPDDIATNVSDDIVTVPNYDIGHRHETINDDSISYETVLYNTPTTAISTIGKDNTENKGKIFIYLF